MKRVRANLYLSQSVKEELMKQCQEVGMDMGNYFTYLILREKERAEDMNRLEKMFCQMFPNGVTDIAKLVEIAKGIEKGGDKQ